MSYGPTLPVSSIFPSGEAPTVPIITAVAVVLIVLVTVLGIVIFVVIIRTTKKKKKQQLKTGKENEFIKLKVKQDRTTEKASSDECLNQNSNFTGDYSEIKLVLAEKGASSEDHSNQSNTFVGEYSLTKVIPADGKVRVALQYTIMVLSSRLLHCPNVTNML